MEMKTNAPHRGVVCVTGGGGYIGSSLVKNLLENGYTVHATLRDPGNNDKSSCLLALPGAEERLQIFKADLSDEGSFDAAIYGCEGVFHVATPTDFGSQDPENEIIQTAIRGTLNVLKSCARAKSVKRVVYTSSVSAASVSATGELDGVGVDESSWTSVDVLRDKKSHGWFYAVSKTLAEKAALQFARENPIEVVSIVPPIVAGPSITGTVPSSVQVTMSLITGNQQWYGLLKSIQFASNSISLIHIEDVCRAHIFLMEHPSVEGRYICSGHRTTMSELADFISKRYPHYNITTKFEDMPATDSDLISISSKKLLDLGFCYKKGLDDIIDDSIQYFQKVGILS